MKALILLLAIGLAPEAHGAPKKENACREGKSFMQEIKNCGQNKLAAAYAKNCADASMGAVKAAGSFLSAQMTALEKTIGASQTAHMGDATDRLQRAISALEIQIASLQKNTALIAAYPQVMIDYPDGEDDETSAGCFSPSFHKIQDSVTSLDEEIIRAKAARQQAITFLQQLKGQTGDLNRLSKTRELASPDSVKSAPPAPKGPKGKNWNASDISGTKPKKKKK